ncbi:MAG: gamma-glutamyltransferase [Planctomycetota bacterium]
MASVAIAVDSPLTADAAAQVARQGGNAVDVAVAAALAATVSETLMCSLGGAGFVTIRMPGKPAEVIDGGDMVPVHREFQADDPVAWRKVSLHYGDGVETMVGAASVAVPGFLAAAGEAWNRHGRLPWKEVVAPALELASRKIPVSQTTWDWLNVCAELMFELDEVARSVFFEAGQIIAADHQLNIPGLGDTFAAIAEEGADSLYRGSLAAPFANAISGLGGLITVDDLNTYRAEVRRPVSIQSGGFELALNSPPAAGGAATAFLIHALDSSSNVSSGGGVVSGLTARAQVDLLRLRDSEMFDGEFNDEKSRELLRLAGNGVNDHLRSPDTTHISVATADGGVASVTLSMGYGAGIIVPGLGICCNNSLGEPEVNPRGYHCSKPGSRISSNMSPTVAWHPDGRCIAIGSPGASRIPTAIAQTWNRIVLDGMSFEDAVAAPRLHVQPDDDNDFVCLHEPGIDVSQFPADLKTMPFDELSRFFGGVKLAGADRSGELQAVADSRRQGAVRYI